MGPCVTKGMSKIHLQMTSQGYHFCFVSFFCTPQSVDKGNETGHEDSESKIKKVNQIKKI